MAKSRDACRAGESHERSQGAKNDPITAMSVAEMAANCN